MGYPFSSSGVFGGSVQKDSSTPEKREIPWVSNSGGFEVWASGFRGFPGGLGVSSVGFRPLGFTVEVFKCMEFRSLTFRA